MFKKKAGNNQEMQKRHGQSRKIRQSVFTKRLEKLESYFCSSTIEICKILVRFFVSTSSLPLQNTFFALALNKKKGRKRQKETGNVRKTGKNM